MDETTPVIITGGGIGGLCLALALNKHCGVPGADIEVYEQAPGFGENVGGAMGLYANGLRVLRDISPQLLRAVRAAGYEYIYRRWMRHDGTEVACAEEAELSVDPELQSIGIRRWKLQRALYEASQAIGVVVKFGVRTEKVEPTADGRVTVSFADGATRRARLVFGADGVKSKTREAVGVSAMAAEFTGVTCMMGVARVARPVRGICFPSSSTTKCHGCVYPTGEREQIFQLYFPAKTMEENWGTLSPEEGRKQCAELADKLAADGWDGAFLEALRAAEGVIRVGRPTGGRRQLARPRTAPPSASLDHLKAPAAPTPPGAPPQPRGGSRRPQQPASGGAKAAGSSAVKPAGLFAREPLDSWTAARGRVVLLGDAAHPPVPYIGQGAMMAMEDVGVLSKLLQHHCCATGKFDPSDANLAAATATYEAMRIPRTKAVLGASHALGATQQRRAESWTYNLWREWSIRYQVARHGTLLTMKPGAAYDYAQDVAATLRNGGAAAQGKGEASTGYSRGVLFAGAAVAAAAAAALLAAKKRA